MALNILSDQNQTDGHMQWVSTVLANPDGHTRWIFTVLVNPTQMYRRKRTCTRVIKEMPRPARGGSCIDLRGSCE